MSLRTEVLANGFDPVRMSGRINQYINDAQFTIARRVNYFSEEKSQAVQTTVGSNLIPFPSDLARVRTLRDTDVNRELDNVGLREIDMSSSSSQGRPLYWAVDGANLHIYPTPDAVYNLSLRYWSLPSTLVADSDVPSLPQDYHNLLITYAVGRSYLAEDDEQTGKFYLDLFDREVQELHVDLVFPTSDEPHQARGMWDQPRSLPGSNTWTWYGL